LKPTRAILWSIAATVPTVTLGGCGAASATPDSAQKAQDTAPKTTSSVATVAPPTSEPDPPATAKTTAEKTASKTGAAQSKDRTVDKTFDDIKFDIKPDAPFRREMITPEIEALAGQRVRLRGYILPTPQKRGIKQFVLVRDNQECCFGPGAALYDCVLVEMEPGRTAEFSIRPVAVEGTFEISVFNGPDDKPLAIYRISGEQVR
jgi:hypothetical protein